MHNSALPFFCRKSLVDKEKSADLRFCNSLGIKLNYSDIAELKKSEFRESLIPETLCRNKFCKSNYTPSFLKEGSKSLWQCPFCETENELLSEHPKIIPSDFYYLTEKIKNDLEKKLLFVFCLDYSGSMNIAYFPLSEQKNIIEMIQVGKMIDEIENYKLVSRKNLVWVIKYRSRKSRY